jgi:hypothetical protein
MRIFCSVQWKMGGKRDQMAVFELAATGFGVGLGAVGGDHVGRGQSLRPVNRIRLPKISASSAWRAWRSTCQAGGNRPGGCR